MSATVSVRALSADETRTLVAARLVAVELAPYLAHALFATRPVAAEGLGTLAVDAAWRLYVDPAVLPEWGVQLVGGVLVHEVSHLVRDHAGRAADAGVSNHVLWNVATDAAINDDLLAAGVELPEGVVTPDGLGLDENGIEEAYYAALVRTPPPGMDTDDSDDSDGEPGCGSGAGDPPAPWELPTDSATAPALSAGDAEMTRRMVAEDIAARADGHGTVPGGWQRWAEKTLAAPTVPWRQILAASVRRAVAWARGAGDYTYSRPGRRRIPGVLTPSLRRPQTTVAVVIDTSGSMSPGQLGAALREVQGVIRAAGIGSRGLRVLTCDADVAATVEVRRAEDVDLIGGGGTDMRVGIAAAETARPAADVIIVLTDGFTPWPEAPTRARLIIGLIGGTPGMDVPAWATTVTIPAEESP